VGKDDGYIALSTNHAADSSERELNVNAFLARN